VQQAEARKGTTINQRLALKGKARPRQATTEALHVAGRCRKETLVAEYCTNKALPQLRKAETSVEIQKVEATKSNAGRARTRNSGPRMLEQLDVHRVQRHLEMWHPTRDTS